LGYGVGSLPRGTFLSFEEARELVWSEGLKSQEQWVQWCDASETTVAMCILSAVEARGVQR
jgi:hypothetical protein